MLGSNFSPLVRNENNPGAGTTQMPIFTKRGLKPYTFYEQSPEGFPIKTTISRKGNVYQNRVYPSGWPSSMVNAQQQAEDPFANPISEDKFRRFLGR